MVLDHIRKTQAQVASTKVHKDFVVVKALNKNLRFTQSVFEKSKSLLRLFFYSALIILIRTRRGSRQRCKPETQSFPPTWTTTENWPLHADVQNSLNDIKYDFRARPLPDYLYNRLNDAQNVQEALRGAFVIFRFELNHFYIGKLALDSLNTTIDSGRDRGPSARRSPSGLDVQTQIRECSRRGYSLEAPPPQLQIGTPLATPVREQEAGMSREHGNKSPSPPSVENAALTDSLMSTPHHISF